MRPEIVAKYEGRRVPRYTSYPTAPHFSPAVGEAAYRDWLAALPAGGALSLYLHIPYCRAMCWYCGCNTRITRQDAPIAAYAAALRREVEAVAALLPGRRPVGHIAFGGGTPTILPPEAFAELLALLRRLFAVAANAEVAVEIDPRHLSDAMVAALAAGGVTRASLGVQSFDPAVQQAINRVQSFEQTAGAVRRLREAGIAAINFDLLYGLPLQSVESCIETADLALALRPDRLSVFGYAHVPTMKRHQRLIPAETLPGGPARLAQFAAIADRLERAGYRRIGLDHFARPDDPMARAAEAGTLRRNFQGYTTDPCDTLIGFGASAIGALPGGYVQNLAEAGAYAEAVAAGRLPVARGCALDDGDRLRRAIIERIMCRYAVDLDATAAELGLPAPDFAAELEALGELARDGLVAVDGRRLAVPAEARPLVRCVAAAFDAYLRPEAGRHSAAV